ncbi:hypothetical protein J6590_018643 [Homalodisca vitripennis]|nr:hypothetical protein J6590_018643 [Homalodisca vitripennis]
MFFCTGGAVDGHTNKDNLDTIRPIVTYTVEPPTSPTLFTSYLHTASMSHRVNSCETSEWRWRGFVLAQKQVRLELGVQYSCKHGAPTDTDS